MYYTKLIETLITYLICEGFTWDGEVSELKHFMYTYQENKVPAIKYLRDNCFQQGEFLLHIPSNVSSTIAINFANSGIIKKVPLGLKEAKDLLDLVHHNSTY